MTCRTLYIAWEGRYVWNLGNCQQRSAWQRRSLLTPSGEGFADKHPNSNMETRQLVYHLSMSKLRNPTGRSSGAAIQISTFGPRHLFLQSQYPSGGGVGGCWAGDEPTLRIQLWYTPTKLNGISQMFHIPLQSSESGLERVCLSSHLSKVITMHLTVVDKW